MDRHFKIEDQIIDGHKVHLHPDKVNEWLRTGDTYPIHIEIGISGMCNQNCVFCALDFVKNKNLNINTETMLKALKEMADNGVRSVMFGGEGEPLMHPDICLLVEKAKEYGLDVAITTNGILFNKEKRERCLPHLTWIKFSVDAGDSETYAKVHRTKPVMFKILLGNIKESVKFKREKNLKVTIGTQFLMIPMNLNTTEETVKKMKKLGVNYISVKPYSHHPDSFNNHVVNKDKYEKVEKKIIKYSDDNFKVCFRKEMIKRIEEGNIYSECYGLSFFCLIDAKGNVIPCNLFYDKKYFNYGNINDKSFSEIWEGENRKRLLQHLRSKGVKQCRHGCRCDVMNRYLHRLKNPNKSDNFT